MESLLTVFRRDRGSNDPFGGIEMGDLAEDTLTGFKGIVIGMNRNISGCDQVSLQPATEDGKFVDPHWFDIERVRLIESGKVQFTSRRTGADVLPPTRTPVA